MTHTEVGTRIVRYDHILSGRTVEGIWNSGLGKLSAAQSSVGVCKLTLEVVQVMQPGL